MTVSTPVEVLIITIFCPLTTFNAPPVGIGACLIIKTSSVPPVPPEFLLSLQSTVISFTVVFEISISRRIASTSVAV